MGNWKHRAYTAPVKADAVAMARRDGQSATAKALGINKTNIHRWLKEAEADGGRGDRAWRGLGGVTPRAVRTKAVSATGYRCASCASCLRALRACADPGARCGP